MATPNSKKRKSPTTSIESSYTQASHESSDDSSHESSPKSKRRSSRSKSFERFRMPFSIKCEGCRSVLSKGMEVDAERKPVGSWHTNKSWRFTFKCCCGSEITVETNHEVVKGGRRNSSPKVEPDYLEQLYRERFGDKKPSSGMSIYEEYCRNKVEALLWNKPIYQ